MNFRQQNLRQSIFIQQSLEAAKQPTSKIVKTKPITESTPTIDEVKPIIKETKPVEPVEQSKVEESKVEEPKVQKITTSRLPNLGK